MFTLTDRNECKEMPDPCFDRAQCINTKGSYFCRCPLGWTFDGKACKGLWEFQDNCSVNKVKCFFWSTITFIIWFAKTLLQVSPVLLFEDSQGASVSI